jgi:hypothetical protein
MNHAIWAFVAAVVAGVCVAGRKPIGEGHRRVQHLPASLPLLLRQRQPGTAADT